MNKFFVQKNYRLRFGFTLVEIILAVALFGLFTVALLGLIMMSYNSNQQGREKQQATLYASQGLEAVWSIRRQGWNLLIDGNYGVTDDGGYWQLLNSPDVLDGKYTRTVTIADACRDASTAVVDCSQPGATLDLHTKKIISQVTYTSVNSISNQVELISLVTTWQSKNWLQTDWSGGSGQTLWSIDNKYNTDDGNVVVSTAGQVSLKTLAANQGSFISPFTSRTAYVFDQTKISVTGGMAQLRSARRTVSGGTVNPSFDTDANGWAFMNWENTNNTVLTGTRNASGGNPTGYVDISISGQKNSTGSGYWYQAFTLPQGNPSSARVNFNWKSILYNQSGITSYRIYIFVDTTPGPPVIGTEVWSATVRQSNQWNRVSNVSVRSRLSAAGTYYLKIVARRITGNQGSPGTNTIGFDNVQLTWSTSGTGYPTDNPSIYPTTSFVNNGVTQWSSFTESAVKNGGEIYYQLSNNNGATWQYWTGSAWATAGVNNYNTANVINSAINTFATSTGRIMFKAFLSSDGTQQVKLDSVTIGYGATTGTGSYATSGWIESSAFNTNSHSAFNFVSWHGSLPSAATTIRLQVATAPDVGGTPGPWSAWMGPRGTNSYYTAQTETLIPFSNNQNDDQWVKYRVYLDGDGNNTPVLNDVIINYTP